MNNDKSNFGAEMFVEGARFLLGEQKLCRAPGVVMHIWQEDGKF